MNNRKYVFAPHNFRTTDRDCMKCGRESSKEYKNIQADDRDGWEEGLCIECIVTADELTKREQQTLADELRRHQRE